MMKSIILHAAGNVFCTPAGSCDGNQTEMETGPFFHVVARGF